MTPAQIAALAAITAAVVASVINGIFNAYLKSRELKLQETITNRAEQTKRAEVALKCAELKHQQLMAVATWNREEAQRAGVPPHPIDFWDPLTSTIEYMRGFKEFTDTGRWEKGESARNRNLEEARHARQARAIANRQWQRIEFDNLNDYSRAVASIQTLADPLQLLGHFRDGRSIWTVDNVVPAALNVMGREADEDPTIRNDRYYIYFAPGTYEIMEPFLAGRYQVAAAQRPRRQNVSLQVGHDNDWDRWFPIAAPPPRNGH